jgi:hypothetical protein
VRILNPLQPMLAFFITIPEMLWVLIAVAALPLFWTVIRFVVLRFLASAPQSNTIKDAGFAYDPLQDIYYTNMDAWQRPYGYCGLFDTVAPLVGMVLDCEPIHFTYGGEKWLIELWKGQYGMLTGAEVGVYTAPIDDRPPTSTHYINTFEKNHLHIEISLLKNGMAKGSPSNIRLFFRNEIHWWLNGFCLGLFSRPRSLTMFAKITMKSAAMAEVVNSALLQMGYTGRDYYFQQNTLCIVFAKPRSRQKLTRTVFGPFVLLINRLLCLRFARITRAFESAKNKMEFLMYTRPRVYRRIQRRMRLNMRPLRPNGRRRKHELS